MKQILLMIFLAFGTYYINIDTAWDDYFVSDKRDVLKIPLGVCCNEMQTVTVCSKAYDYCPTGSWNNAQVAASICNIDKWEENCGEENTNVKNGDGNYKLSLNQDCDTFGRGDCTVLEVVENMIYWCIPGPADPISPLCGSKKSKILCE